jgi:hypothetical protein
MIPARGQKVCTGYPLFFSKVEAMRDVCQKLLALGSMAASVPQSDNQKISRALPARSIDYRKNGSTRQLLPIPHSYDEKHGTPS